MGLDTTNRIVRPPRPMPTIKREGSDFSATIFWTLGFVFAIALNVVAWLYVYPAYLRWAVGQ